jgi:3'-phosphoadenosine 5'-phosphosulfate (PAPS) 3'-phosphatase
MFKQRQALLEFALQLIKAAAEQIMPHYYGCVVNTKPDGTDVTEADRRAEEVVREAVVSPTRGMSVQARCPAGSTD